MMICRILKCLRCFSQIDANEYAVEVFNGGKITDVDLAVNI